MDDRVKVTISEGVADVRLVRADKMNALDERCSKPSSQPATGFPAKKGCGGGVIWRGAGFLRRPRHGPLCGDEGEGR